MIRIGISGWVYEGWRGEFYPRGLPQRRELEYATRVLNSIEINGTFYALQSPKSFARWETTVPQDFVFAVKGSRYITHTRRLRDVESALSNFFASGVLRLGSKLGPLLWQLPPHMEFKPDDVERFCELLPQDTRAAVELARRHTDQVKHTWFDVQSHHRLRYAFEPRDKRWINDQFLRILQRHGHAYVFADTAGKLPLVEDITAGFVYVRLHGSRELYASGYDDQELDWWRQRIVCWSRGERFEEGTHLAKRKPPARKSRDVYVYFDNDAKVHAPYNALRLAQMLNIAPDPQQLTAADGERLPPPPRLK